MVIAERVLERLEETERICLYCGTSAGLLYALVAFLAKVIRWALRCQEAELRLFLLMGEEMVWDDILHSSSRKDKKGQETIASDTELQKDCFLKQKRRKDVNRTRTASVGIVSSLLGGRYPGDAGRDPGQKRNLSTIGKCHLGRNLSLVA